MKALERTVAMAARMVERGMRPEVAYVPVADFVELMSGAGLYWIEAANGDKGLVLEGVGGIYPRGGMLVRAHGDGYSVTGAAS